MLALWILLALPAQEIEPDTVHLRSGSEREWLSFPEAVTEATLELRFAAEPNAQEWTLRFRQEDVKQVWKVTLNDQSLGELIRDENPIETVFAIPPRLLRPQNVLRIAAGATNPSDDITLSRIGLDRRSRAAVLSDARLTVQVRDEATGQPLPCRITVVDESGALPMMGVNSDRQTAVRPGVCYTATGTGRLQLPVGRYTVYAGRGLEYSLADSKIDLKAGDEQPVSLTIRREVPTDGYVACDTHIHTLTHSGHGDATIEERLVTIAGEGIELPIAADHNRQIDYRPLQKTLELDQWFTSVVGNEVTTSHGHFNIFPVPASTVVPDHRLTDWTELLSNIQQKTAAPITILNHARDLHSGFRPFAPEHFNAASGDHAFPWPAGLTGMEVINSGATQSEPLQLIHDWMALLNRGRNITPVGSSDSHDVARHFVGQGRTYIRCEDSLPGRIDTDSAVKAFNEGRVIVSYGLLAEIVVDDRYHPGDLATTARSEWSVKVRVLGPRWVRAKKAMLFANGRMVHEAAIEGPAKNGVVAEFHWTLPKMPHDVHLVAVAVGDGVTGLYWPTAKPYQPTSQDPTTMTLSCSGPVWLDGDDDGRRTAARGYAERIVAEHNGDLARILKQLERYDTAVAIQTASVLETAGHDLQLSASEPLIRNTAPSVRAGIEEYRQSGFRPRQR